jgi:hypothetical protein
MTDKQKTHYQWMLENLELSERHRYWIIQQLEKKA